MHLNGICPYLSLDGTFVCYECESSGAILSSLHKHDHTIVRCQSRRQDVTSLQQFKAMEAQLLEMKEQLIAVSDGSLKTEEIVDWMKGKSTLLLFSILLVPDIRWFALLAILCRWLELF